MNNIPFLILCRQTDLLWRYNILKFVATRLRMFLIKKTKHKTNVLPRQYRLCRRTVIYLIDLYNDFVSKIHRLSHKISLQSALGLCSPFCRTQSERRNWNAHQLKQHPKTSKATNAARKENKNDVCMYTKTRSKAPEKT